MTITQRTTITFCIPQDENELTMFCNLNDMDGWRFTQTSNTVTYFKQQTVFRNVFKPWKNRKSEGEQS